MRFTSGDISALIQAYFDEAPRHEVSFGTSGHRGSSLKGSFNDLHIAAICQAVSELRPAKGPLFLGKDTHALSEPASKTALEVLEANSVPVVLDADYSPTPVISHAVLSYNNGRTEGLADAIIITPSHNPPDDGGLKYNPPSGGPAPQQLTRAIEARSRELMRNQHLIKRSASKRSSQTVTRKLMVDYVNDLASVVDMKAIAESDLAIGVDPMGGAAVNYWDMIADTYKINLKVVNPVVDPCFAFMPLDHDQRVRMDCSSRDAMANLVSLRDQFDVSFANDPDVDRHGIVTRSVGLMNPNHFLAVAGSYLFESRNKWPAQAAWAKTLVSSSMLDRVAAVRERAIYEVPVGFKWFVDGLKAGDLAFAGEESAGATFLRQDGTVWTTDKDGIVMGLLAAEILAQTGRDPGEHYRDFEERFGRAYYRRVDAPATPEQKTILGSMSPHHVSTTSLAGEPIERKQTRAPGNDAPIGGLKVATANGWFAARPSGTEEVYKIYAESFVSESHLASILEEAQTIVAQAMAA